MTGRWRETLPLLLAAWLASSPLSGAEPDLSGFRRDLELRSLRYFVENAHPVTGLVRDRAFNDRKESDPKYRIASLAATGMGLAVIANAALRGQLSVPAASAQIGRTLAFVASALAHHEGWLYHFVDWETGARFGTSEVSTVDTAWFVTGALYAARIFPEHERVADLLYRRVDFLDMMTNGGKKPDKRTLALGWLPESGYLPWDWVSYAEQMVLLVLGLGHPTRPLPPETWDHFARPLYGAIVGPELPLFAHQYSHLFIDFRRHRDKYADYYASSVAATLRDRRECAEDNRYRTYRAGYWGRSASGSAHGYKAFSPDFHNGTVCLGCAGASAFFVPEVLRDMYAWATGPLGRQIYGHYGFVDSLSLDENWVDPDVIGITVGALYLALADLDPRRPVWADFEAIPAVRLGLVRAGM